MTFPSPSPKRRRGEDLGLQPTLEGMPHKIPPQFRRIGITFAPKPALHAPQAKARDEDQIGEQGIREAVIFPIVSSS